MDKLNKIFYVSSRLDVLAASRDFNVGVGVCVGVGVWASLKERRGGATRTTAFVRSCN
ncbi:MAG: hypothetical protein IJE77_09115 [Thermoguttaceae bacterium]|nr:hypothetical protein [Thermoguttaceae bacterium]